MECDHDPLPGIPCRACAKNAYMAQWYAANSDRVKGYVRNYRQRCKDEVLEHYGRSCACCGEWHPRFLTVDHINDDGAEHGRLLGSSHRRNIYRWLIVNGFPEGFQILCWNCNSGRAANGGICPHKEMVT